MASFGLDIPETLNGDDYISGNNIDELVSYLDDKYGKDYDFKYEKTADGHIKITLNDIDFLDLNDNYKVGQVVNAISSYVEDISQNKAKQKNTNRPRIQINLAVANEIRQIYAKAAAELNNFYSYIDHSYIVDKLREYYDTLGDNTPELLYALANYANGLTQTIDYCLQMYLSKDQKDYAELESLCEELWGSLEEMHNTYKTAANMSKQPKLSNSLTNLDNLSPEDYLEIMNGSGELFNALYSDSIEEFQSKLGLAYQAFLRDSLPQIYNTLLDNLCTIYDCNLEVIKEKVTRDILDNDKYTFDWINDHVPADVWYSVTSDYERALLLVSYDEDAISYDYLDITVDEYVKDKCFDNNFIASLVGYIGMEAPNPNHLDIYEEVAKACFPTMQALNILKTYCTTDYSQYSPDEAINFAYETLSHLSFISDAKTTHSAYIGESVVARLVGGPKGDYENIINDETDSLLYAEKRQSVIWRGWAKAFEEDEELQEAFIRYKNQKIEESGLGLPYESFEDYKNKNRSYGPSSGIADYRLRYFYPASEQGGADWFYFSRDGSSSDLSDPNFKLGYEDAYGKYLRDDTFNDEFLIWYAKEKGMASLKRLTDSYYRNIGYSENDLNNYMDGLVYNEYTMNAVTASDIFNYVSPFTNIFQDFCQEKITIDATRNNLAMSAAHALIIDDITDEQALEVKDYYYDIVKKLNREKISLFDQSGEEENEGWDYLEDWQKKALYKIYTISPDLAEDLIYQGLHNEVIQKIGFEKAEATAARMTGSDIDDNTLRDIYRGLLGVPYTATAGVWEGLWGSVENVVNVATADGIMNQGDYYDLRLLELIKDDTLINDVYGFTNGIGNMIIPMALSTFVPVIGTELSLAWTGLATYGGTLESMLQSGYDRETSYKVAACKGLAAVFTEKMLNYVGFGDSDEPLKIFNKLTGSNSKMLQFIGYGLSNQIREIGEELTENSVDYLIEGIFLNEWPTFDQVVKDSLMTVYQTFLTTPCINLVGKGFQKLAPNEPYHVKLEDGTELTYTKAELEQFVDTDGNLNQNDFFKFLADNDRINLEIANAKKLMNNVIDISTASTEKTRQESINSLVTLFGGEVAGINVDQDGNYVIRTKYGQEIVRSPSQIGSQNFEYEIKSMNNQYEYEMALDYYYDVVEKDFNKDWIPESIAKNAVILEYEQKNGEGSFYKLSEDERKQLIQKELSSHDEAYYKAEEKRIAESYVATAVSKLLEYQANGELKDGVSVTDLIASQATQKYLDPYSVFTEEHVKEWRSSFETEGCAPGYTKVYVFQDRGSSYALNKGAYGRGDSPERPGGMFVTSSTQFEDLKAKYYNESSNSWNLMGLGEDLGGVLFDSGSTVVIEIELPISDLELPTANNQGSALGPWIIGGETSGGAKEAVVAPFTNDTKPDDYTVTIDPQNNN